MPPICNADASGKCPHGGSVSFSAKQFKVMVDGSPALTIMDVMGASVSGCGQKPPPPGFVPCASTLSPASPGSTKVMIGGMPAALPGGVMVTNGIPVPGPATIADAGQSKVMAGG